METRELFPVQGSQFILEFVDEPIWLLALDTHCVEETSESWEMHLVKAGIICIYDCIFLLYLLH
jgi:hypothetical protein